MCEEGRVKVNEKRRLFLLQATAAAGVAACGPSGSMMTGDGGSMGGFRPSGFTVGDLAVGEVKGNDLLPFFVARDAGGIYAYSNVCTHQQCPLNLPNAMGISDCSCRHGSTFDSVGTLVTRATSGAAVANQTNLPHYAVQLDGSGATARILVNIDSTLSGNATRAAVT